MFRPDAVRRWPRSAAQCPAPATSSPVASSPVASPPLPPQPLPPGYLAAQQAAQTSWPHTITREGASVTVYQPQAIDWPDHQKLTARAAVAITQAGHTQPILGTIELTLATQTDEATGIVHLSDPELLNSHFPSLDTQQAQDLQAKISAALPSMDTHEVPLTAVLLSLGQAPVASVPVDNDPPVIFAADHPASLLVFDGEPVLVPVGNTTLTVAVNTNWDVFADQGTWYLLNSGVWFSAPQADGPYAVISRLPPVFSNLPNDKNFAEVRRSIPARPPAAGYKAPQIFVSTKPAEIIVTDGPPSLQPGCGHRFATRGQHLQHFVFRSGGGQFLRAVVGSLVLGAWARRAVGLRHRQIAAGFCADST